MNKNFAPNAQLPTSIRVFGLPLQIVQRCENLLRSTQIRWSVRNVVVGNFKVPAAIFRTTKQEETTALVKLISSITGTTVFSEWRLACLGRQCIQYFCGQVGVVTLQALRDSQSMRLLRYTLLQEVLRVFSGLVGGVDIVLYGEGASDAGEYPRPEKANTLHIFPCNHPTGVCEKKYLKRAFGEPLVDESQGVTILVFSGIPGRGILIEDEDGENMVQLLGANWYFLFSVVGHLDECSKNQQFPIFEKALSVAYAKWRTLKKQSLTKSSIGKKSFCSSVHHWSFHQDRQLAQQQERTEKKLERLRRELMELERELYQIDELRAVIRESAQSRDFPSLLAQQWRLMRANPSLECVDVVAGGIQVVTVPIKIEHQGVRYLLGRYEIRFDPGGMLNIWSIDGRHSGNVPHPHINRHGTPCFGNATSAIQKAVVQCQWARALDYLIPWLRDGYQHDLARTKITEWPYENPDGSITEVVVLRPGDDSF